MLLDGLCLATTERSCSNLMQVLFVRLWREEAQEQTRRAVHHHERTTELEALLDGVKTRVQELEDRCLGKAARQFSGTQQLQQEKQEALVGVKTTTTNYVANTKNGKLLFIVAMRDSRRGSYQAEGVSRSAPEEASLRGQRGGTSAGAAKSGFSGRLQQSLPAELASGPAVSDAVPPSCFSRCHSDENFHRGVFSPLPRLQDVGRDRLLRGQNESSARRAPVRQNDNARFLIPCSNKRMFVRTN